MKKRTAGIIAVTMLSACILAGCDKDEESTQEKEVTFADKMEAYRDFYDEFVSEHGGQASARTDLVDCGAKIVMDKNDEPLLTIYDVTDATEDSCVADYYVYALDEEGKVKTKVVLNGIGAWKSLNLATVGKYQYLMYKDNDNTVYCYELDGKEFKPVYQKQSELAAYDDDLGHGITYGSVEAIVEDSFDSQDGKDDFNMVNAPNVSGSEFDNLLKNMGKEKISNAVDLAEFYTRYTGNILNYSFKTENKDELTLACFKSGNSYYLLKNNKEAELVRLSAEDEIAIEIESYPVTAINIGKSDLENASTTRESLVIPEGIKNIKSLKVNTLQYVQIPDSVESVENIDGNFYLTVFGSSNVEKYARQQNKLFVKGTIEDDLQTGQQLAAAMEAYGECVKKESVKEGILLAYIDNDQIPELVLARGYGNADILTYKDGVATWLYAFAYRTKYMTDGSVSYIPYKNEIYSYLSSIDYVDERKWVNEREWVIEGNKLVCKIALEYIMSTKGEGKVYYYESNEGYEEKSITKEEYDAKEKDMQALKEKCISVEFQDVSNYSMIQAFYDCRDAVRGIESESEAETSKQEMTKAAETTTAATTASSSTTAAGDYILPNSNSAYLTETDISALSKEQLRLARNEIYARHGYIFNADDLKSYFSAKSWYKESIAANDFNDSMLNDYEIKNRDFIKQHEG